MAVPIRPATAARPRVPDLQLASFTGAGTYRTVQLLLAILVGAPTQARAIFTTILHADPDTALTDVINTGQPDDPIRAHISQILASTTADHPTETGRQAGAFQPWIPRLARYSFHTRDLTTWTPDR
jgi:hypothetical protein